MNSWLVPREYKSINKGSAKWFTIWSKNIKPHDKHTRGAKIHVVGLLFCNPTVNCYLMGKIRLAINSNWALNEKGFNMRKNFKWSTVTRCSLNPLSRALSVMILRKERQFYFLFIDISSILINKTIASKKRLSFLDPKSSSNKQCLASNSFTTLVKR